MHRRASRICRSKHASSVCRSRNPFGRDDMTHRRMSNGHKTFVGRLGAHYRPRAAAQRRRPRDLKEEIVALARALQKELGAIQHEHQAAIAKGPQSSTGSLSLACPLFVVPFFAAATAEHQQSAVVRLPPPRHREYVLATNIADTSATISGVRYVEDADFAKRRSLAGVSPKRASAPASAGGCTKSWPTSSGQWRRSPKCDAPTRPKWCCSSWWRACETSAALTS
jgi:hypothetical protein